MDEHVAFVFAGGSVPGDSVTDELGGWSGHEFAVAVFAQETRILRPCVQNSRHRLQIHRFLAPASRRLELAGQPVPSF